MIEHNVFINSSKSLRRLPLQLEYTLLLALLSHVSHKQIVKQFKVFNQDRDRAGAFMLRDFERLQHVELELGLELVHEQTQVCSDFLVILALGEFGPAER